MSDITKAKKLGIQFAPEVTIQITQDRNDKWFGRLSLEDEYYETDLYADKKLVVAELQGYTEKLMDNLKNEFSKLLESEK